MHDPKVSALSYLPLLFWLLGYPDEARRASAIAFRCAEEMNQANLTGHVRMFAGAALHELLRDCRAVREHAEASSTSRDGMACATGS